MASAGEGSSYEGGAGGKFRRRPHRRPPSTPYDRPPTAIRRTSAAAAAAGTGTTKSSWVLRLVDPASRIISTGAQKLFSSVFRKTHLLHALPPPPPPPEPNHDTQNNSPEAVAHNVTEANEGFSNGGDRLHNNSDTNVIGDLEQILKQKTFTRAEIDRLTELLRSRTVDESAEDKKKRSEPSTSKLVASFGGTESSPEQETHRQSLIGKASPPVFLEDGVATPVDYAKAYMGSKNSNITPSKLGWHNQASRENAAVPYVTQKSPSKALVPSPMDFNSVSMANGYLTPGLRGRSALYNMTRAQYSGVRHTTTPKIAGITSEGNIGPSGYWENISSGGKQVPKRRSSVLDSDIGSAGPIRRIRQKTNLMPSLRSPGSLSYWVTPLGSEVSHRPTQKPLQINEFKHNISERAQVDNVNSKASTSVASVPSQSSETARKILQQLEFLSPKKRTPESTKLTPDMLRGRALKSMEDVDSSNLIHALHDSDVSDGVRNNHGVTARETTQKHVKVHENGPSKISVLRDDKLGAEANGVVTTLSTKDDRPSVNTADFGISSFGSIPSQKKRAFQMSAHEDSLDFDEDVITGIVVPTPSATDKGKISLVEGKVAVTETVRVEKPVVSYSEINPPGFIVQKPSVVGSSDASPTVEKSSGFPFSVLNPPSAILEPAAPTQQSSSFARPASLSELKSTDAFTFKSKSPDKANPFTSSSASAVSESPIPKFGAPSSGPALANMDQASLESDKGIKEENQKVQQKESEKTGDLFRKPELAVSSAISSSTSLFSFGTSTSNSSPNNGSLFSPSSPFSVSATPISDKSTNGFFSSGSNTVTTTADATRSSPAVSSGSPSFSAVVPVFQFGSTASAAPSQSISASLLPESSGLDSTDSKLKTKQTPSFGSLTSSPFGMTPALTGSSGSPFVFGGSSAKPSSSDNNHITSSNNSATATSGPIFSKQTTIGAGVAPSTQSTSTQVTSSASPIFGSGSSSFSFSSSLFGSSSSASSLFGSAPSFGTSYSVFSMSTGSVSSGSGTTSSTNTASQSAPTSGFGSVFGTTSSTSFVFGAPSAASTAVGSAPMNFGSPFGASSSPFSFTSAAATTSSAPNSSSFPVFTTSDAVSTFASPSNDQMNMEDSMAEDTMQASTPVVSVFGQVASSPQSNLMFGSPSGQSLFQMNGQQAPAATQNPSPFASATTQNPSPFSAVTAQNPSPFQGSGSISGFDPTGSFSLGTGGDKSNRKIIKVRRDKGRRR